MGDRVVITNIEFIYGTKFQIDLHNENKDEHYRVFVGLDEFYDMLDSAIGRAETEPQKINHDSLCETETFKVGD